MKRSLIKVAEAKVDTKVPWGHVLTCGICSETSETASEWGRTVRMKRASPEGGMGDQPVGPACAQHYIFHAKNLAWVDWDRFCTLYHESETFAASVDEGVENMACDAEALEVNYARESVTEEDTQFFEIRAPEAYLLKHGEYLKEFEKDPRKNKSAKSVLVPNLDGTPGTSQYFLADRLGQPPYPTIRAVLCLGAKRARQILEPSEHIFQSQGKLAFEHMNEVRADLHSLGPLWESRGNWEALAGEPVADTAEAPAQPAAGPAASAAAPAPPPHGRGLSDAEPTIQRASCSRGQAKLTQEGLRRLSSFPPRLKGSPPAKPSPSAKFARGAQADEDAESLPPGSAIADDEADSAAEPENKTDYWIKENNVELILSGFALGVQEHQAELRLKKLTKFAEENPSDKRFASEITRLTSHLKKVTVCKKLRADSIVHLSDAEFSAALLALGHGFQFPSTTRQNMVLRRLTLRRHDAMKGQVSAARQAAWTEVCKILSPPPIEGALGFDPAAAELAACDLEDHDICKMIRHELVENSLVPLIVDHKGDDGNLFDFTTSVLKVYEALWEEYSDLATKTISAINSCVRGIDFLLCSEALGDDEALADLQVLADGATATDKKTIKAILGSAVYANEKLCARMEECLRCQKHIVQARPLHEHLVAELEKYGPNAEDEGHFKLLADASRFLTTWRSKLPDGSLDCLAENVRQRVMVCGTALASRPCDSKSATAGAASDRIAIVQMKRSFSRALEDIDLAYSLDNDVATLKHELFEDIKVSNNAIRVQEVEASIAKMMEAHKELGREQAIPESALTDAAALGKQLDELHGLDFAPGLMEKFVDFLLQACEAIMEDSCTHLLDLGRTCFPWLGARSKAMVLLSEEALKVKSYHANFEKAEGAAAELKATLDLERVCLAFDTAAKTLGSQAGGHKPPGSMLAVCESAKAKVASTKQALVEGAIASMEKDIAEAHAQKPAWKTDLPKNSSLKQLVQAWRASGIKSKDVEMSAKKLDQAPAQRAPLTALVNLQSTL